MGQLPEPTVNDLRKLRTELMSDDSEEAFKRRWDEVLDALEEVTAKFEKDKSDVIPSLAYADLPNLQPSSQQYKRIKEAGCVVIRNVISEEQAQKWFNGLKENSDNNPNYNDKMRQNPIFRIHWSQPQVEARAHKDIIRAASLMTELFWTAPEKYAVSLNTQLAYEDRFRIRKQGVSGWSLGPHIDGGGLNCWTLPSYRKCYEPIFSADPTGYKDLDLYESSSKITAHEELVKGFRAWQASVALTPGEGGLEVFPNLNLSIAYVLLRPFFEPIEPRGKLGTKAYLDKSNWQPAIEPNFLRTGANAGQKLSDDTHPHLKLQEGGMVDLPPLNRGDYVFWHNDLIHAVSRTPPKDGPSSVMYIPSFPLCRSNVKYLALQREAFLKSKPSPDMSVDPIIEQGYNLTADLKFLEKLGVQAMQSMGFAPLEENVGTEGEMEIRKEANKVLGHMTAVRAM